MKGMNRRELLKKSMIICGLAVIPPTVYTPRASARWAPKTFDHPEVNPLRVVGISDKRMAKEQEILNSWSRQEELVQKEMVWENIGRLACSLAESGNPPEAWRRIFLKPRDKGWGETVVAIKTNNIFNQHTRSAVMAGVCRSLTDYLGVKPGNIHIYDGCHGRNGLSPFTDLPPGVRVENAWGGYSAKAKVPEPWNGGSTPCVRAFVDGTVDILINIALCKGHGVEVGGFTMTMKNHFGTFHPLPGHKEGELDYLIAINQTPEILGNIDQKTGRIIFPRQQLCIIDALWASKGGPTGLPSAQPNFLAMGVSSPIVDYVIATKFRAEKMGWPVNVGNTRRFLTDFGYEESDLPSGGGLLEL